MQYLKHIMASAVALLVLSACGGGGGNSGPSPATITSNNAKDIAVASTNTASNSKSSSILNIFGKTSAPDTQLIVSNIIAKNIAQIQQATENLGMCSSGTGDMEFSETTAATITFNNCTITGTESNPVILTGTAYYSSADNGNTIVLRYVNFTINFDGDISTINASISCSGINAGTISCSYNLDFTGSDGRHYIVGSITVSGDPYTGLTVSATVTDPNHGVFSMNTTTPVTFNCATPNEHIPDSGSITFTGTGGSTGSVTYNNCTSYTVTFNDIPTIYNW